MKQKSLDYSKIISEYREVIESENRRIIERMTIFCQFQGFLFAALALGWEKPNNKDLFYMLAGLGACSAGVLMRALYMAVSGINRLNETYLKFPEEERKLSAPVVGNIPVGKNPLKNDHYRVYFTPPLVLPVLMILAWSFIISSKVWKLF